MVLQKQKKKLNFNGMERLEMCGRDSLIVGNTVVSNTVVLNIVMLNIVVLNTVVSNIAVLLKIRGTMLKIKGWVPGLVARGCPGSNAHSNLTSRHKCNVSC